MTFPRTRPHSPERPVLPRSTMARLRNTRARAALWSLVTGVVLMHEAAQLWAVLVH